MKESIQRIKREGHSELLEEMVKRSRVLAFRSALLKKCCKESFPALSNSNGVCSFHEGSVGMSNSMRIQLGLNRVIAVDAESHELLSVNGDVSGVEKNQVLDLSDEGERWEGDVLNDEPYGWGVLYDKEGEKVYEGFRIGDVSVCYGIQYYADIGVKEYEGEICDGKRWGRGIQYDRNGVVVYDGEWMNDEHELEKKVVITCENSLLHTLVEELTVSKNCCNGEEWKALDFSLMHNLRELVIEQDSFAFVEEVKLIGLQKLERVYISSNCFSWARDGNDHSCYGIFCLKDCPLVKELYIDRTSCMSYSVCEIENNASMTSICFGSTTEYGANFINASLELKSAGDGMS